jgi:hypothetical protein
VTTTRLNKTTRRARWFDLPVPLAAAICIFALLAIAGLIGKIHGFASAVAEPTPAIIIIASPLPVHPPTAAPMVQVAVQLPRFVTCFDQPVGGTVLGPIPEPDASAIVARYGAAWVMTPWNGGYCWLRAADVGLPNVADLAPAPAPVVVMENVPEAVPTPAMPMQTAAEVTPDAAPVVWATSGPIRKEDFKEPDPAARCAFTGCL